MEIYWLVSGLPLPWPDRDFAVAVLGRSMRFVPLRLVASALVSGLLGTAVEFVKLVHTPWLEWFRGTLAGVLLLGRFFSWWDILAYWVAVGLAAVLDAWLIRGSFERRATLLRRP